MIFWNLVVRFTLKATSAPSEGLSCRIQWKGGEGVADG